MKKKYFLNNLPSFTLLFFFALALGLTVHQVQIRQTLFSLAAEDDKPVVGKQVIIADSGNPKRPEIVLVSGNMFVSWSNDGGAMLATQNGGTFTNAKVGKITGDPNHFNTSIAEANAKLHYVWIVDGKKIVHKSKERFGTWSAEHTVAVNQDYANDISLVAQQETVIAMWRLRDGELMLAQSFDSGVTWTTSSVGTRSYGALPRFAKNPEIYAAWLGENDNFHPYLGKWNGFTFTYQPLLQGVTFSDPEEEAYNPSARTSRFREPQIAASPSGQLVAALRTDEDPYYAEQQFDGSWRVQKLSSEGDITPQMAIKVDRAGNVHIAWAGNHQGNRHVLYAMKKAGEDRFSTPYSISKAPFYTGEYPVNLAMALQEAGKIVNVHVVWERFYRKNKDDEWPEHMLLHNTIRVTLPIPAPPPPPCLNLDALGKCVEVESSIGPFGTLPPGFIKKTYSILLSLSGGIAILLIMYAGYVLMTSRGNADQLKKGKEILAAVIIGLLTLIFTFVILEVIVFDILKLPGFAR